MQVKVNENCSDDLKALEMRAQMAESLAALYHEKYLAKKELSEILLSQLQLKSQDAMKSEIIGEVENKVKSELNRDSFKSMIRNMCDEAVQEALENSRNPNCECHNETGLFTPPSQASDYSQDIDDSATSNDEDVMEGCKFYGLRTNMTNRNCHGNLTKLYANVGTHLIPHYDEESLQIAAKYDWYN